MYSYIKKYAACDVLFVLPKKQSAGSSLHAQARPAAPKAAAGYYRVWLPCSPALLVLSLT